MNRRACLLLLVIGCGDGTATPDAATDGGRDAVTSCASMPGWTDAPALARGPTQETATVAVAGRIYVLGGFDASLAVLAAVQVFDTETCAWTAGPELPRPVHHVNAAVVGGRIYVVGAMEGLNFSSIGVTWSWDPATEAAWSTHTPMPAGTQRGASIIGVIDDKIYVVGGLRSGAVAEVSAYDPATDTWDTSLPALPEIRDHGCGGAVGATLYVTGGRRGGIGTTTASVFAYTPGGAWAMRAGMPTARGGTACGVIDDRIYVVGGEGNPDLPSGVFPQVEGYHPATDTWTTHAPMPIPKHGMGAAAWGGSLYVPGGATTEAFGAVAAHAIFTP